jgi:ketosteroid isomerase-like protein
MSDSKTAELEARIQKLEARLRELEDVREINEVFFKWHDHCTGGFSGKQAGRMEALECLTEDATIEVDSMHEPGKGPKGRKAYTEFWAYFYGDAGPLPYVFQNGVAEMVVVTGDTAVQKSNMLGIFQMRDGTTTFGLSQRVNDFVRTPDGWKIRKTTSGPGLSIRPEGIHGKLNALPPAEPRTPWTYKG